jgi:predicted ArsR family transcriptional regulator
MPTIHFLSQHQLESLTSPHRLAIVQRLYVDKQATAAELAQRMGRPVTSLYHHLKQLEDVGVIRVASERKGSRRPEAVYALVADDLSTAQAVKTPSGRKTYGRAAARVADAGARAFSAAVTRDDLRFEGEQRNAMVRFYVLRANQEKIAQLNALLNELDQAASHSCEQGEEIQISVLMSPMSSKR